MTDRDLVSLPPKAKVMEIQMSEFRRSAFGLVVGLELVCVVVETCPCQSQFIA
jgi:hypothetical protein